MSDRKTTKKLVNTHGDHAIEDHGEITAIRVVRPSLIKSSLIQHHRISFPSPKYHEYERILYKDGTVIYYPLV